MRPGFSQPTNRAAGRGQFWSPTRRLSPLRRDRCRDRGQSAEASQFDLLHWTRTRVESTAHWRGGIRLFHDASNPDSYGWRSQPAGIILRPGAGLLRSLPGKCSDYSDGSNGERGPGDSFNWRGVIEHGDHCRAMIRRALLSVARIEMLRALLHGLFLDELGCAGIQPDRQIALLSRAAN